MKRRPSEHRLLEVEADGLWSTLIRAKAIEGRCAVCNHVKPLQAMHIFSRSHKAGGLRWDLDNGAPGCAGCHLRLGLDHEAHRDFCLRYIGSERYDRLKLMKDARGRRPDVRAIIVWLRCECMRLGVIPPRPPGAPRLLHQHAVPIEPPKEPPF